MMQGRLHLPPVSPSTNFPSHSPLNVVKLPSWSWVTALKSIDYRDRGVCVVSQNAMDAKPTEFSLPCLSRWPCQGPRIAPRGT